MFHRRKSVGAAFVVATASSLVLSYSPAEADFSPQPKDVVTTGSDIIQNSFNFLADGYHELPGFNTAGNRYRFVNFDSSGDAQGRSGFTDPRLLPTITGDGNNGTVVGTKYIKQTDVKLLNPTISLRAGQDLVVRPSGGGAGGVTAIIKDEDRWIDVGRSPNPLTDQNQTDADGNLDTKLYRVQLATDRQLLAVSSVATNAPATISAADVLGIYHGTITTWSQVTGYSGPNGSTLITPLTLPSDAGMWTTFINTLQKQNPSVTGINDAYLRANPNQIQVQQNDPTAITTLNGALQPNAIVPFPRGRFNVLNKGYYTDPASTNAYNLEPERQSITAAGITLLDPNATAESTNPASPYGGNFGYNAIIREEDVNSTTVWQPGSTLNWVQALFYNPDPDGPEPFVNTPAGKALLVQAGVVPDYKVFGTNNAQVE